MLVKKDAAVDATLISSHRRPRKKINLEKAPHDRQEKEQKNDACLYPNIHGLPKSKGSVMRISIIFLSCILVFIYPSTAHAYLDPATGSMLASALIGIIATLFFMLKALYYNGAGFILSMFGKAPKRTRASLVFYSEGKQYWNVFKPVLDGLSSLGEESVYLTSDKDDPALQYALPGLTKQYIGKGNRAFSYLNMLEADVCIMTTPGLDTLQIRRSSGVGHYMHLVHAVGDTSMYRMYGLDYYDSVAISGEYQKVSGQALERLRGTKPKRYLESGCPYFDVLMEKKCSAQLKEALSDQADVSCILVAPTWNKNGLLSRYGDALLKPLAEAGHTLIIRPHPQSHFSEPELIKELQESTKMLPNVTWDMSPDNFDAMLSADVLISDYSGIIYDFAFIMERPVLIMDFTPDTAPYDADDLAEPPWDFQMVEKFGKRICVEDVPKIPEIVADILKRGTFKKDLQQIRSEHIFNFACAGPIIAQQIIDIRNLQQQGISEGVSC